MPIFRLTDEIAFPPPHLADKNGLLAVGGDLKEERILLAYTLGIFPWYSDESPILWWSPDPRLILIPEELKVSRSLRQKINKGVYKITFNEAFLQVIENCAYTVRKNQEGTWITEEMAEAYTKLHYSGYAHSVETWHNGELAGGLYGLLIGKVFFGESMFSKQTDASKVAFVALVGRLRELGVRLIDCQVASEHLINFGSKKIPRKKFLEMIGEELN